jgi:hypothetical protein
MKIYKKIMSIVSLIVAMICLIVFYVFALQLVLELADELGFTDIWFHLISIAFTCLYFIAGLIPISITYIVWKDKKGDE